MSKYFQKIKCIDNSIKYLVYGYIHKVEQQVQLFCNISLNIHHICLSYFYHNEYFRKCNPVNQHINLSANKLTVTKLLRPGLRSDVKTNTNIFNIYPLIVEWKLRISRTPTNNAKFQNSLLIIWLQSYRKHKNSLKCESTEMFKYVGNHGIPFNLDSSDTLAIEINTHKQTINRQKNSNVKVMYKYTQEQQELIFANGIQYNLLIGMQNCQDSISLIDFNFRMLSVS